MTNAAAKYASGDEAAMQSLANAMREAATAPSGHSAQVMQSASETGATALESVSRMAYTGSYVVSDGIVYAAVFLTQSLPRENPIMHGFRDGGRAAMDELSEG